MNRTEIHRYLKQFFLENDSPILEESDSHLHIQLSVAMDKALMNRPFYWHYIEKIGGQPAPYQLTLITDAEKADESIKGEKIHFGSPRLHQIFQTATQLGRYALLYEAVSPAGNSLPLKPWLVLNGNISYCCDHKKDRFFSIGLSLITGEMINDAAEQLKNKQFQVQIPDYCFTISPVIMPEAGLERIRKYFIQQLEQEAHIWAEEAVERWKADEELLEAFYDGEDEKPDSYYQEKEALRAQYEPKIDIDIINGGLFYCHRHPLDA
ncbi:protein YqhG of unknown function [Evansella caseinilytica]|uniref:Uncharacterized protein n=1 Tax=Evansella caseinilytica TaxID=1503961 RepID=A0A1H3KTG1_9BACI|nr:YqhG family protein [Evansella caseinilytica]SDY55401.1 protein YqhG of unknown function [Evansella caseinilytica]